MSEEITGRVIAITSDSYARFVIVEHITPNNYIRMVSCRFYGDNRNQQIIGVDVGDQVKIVGGAESREGKGQFSGRWFTQFEAFKCSKIKNSNSQDSPNDDDNLAF